jgi:hypothetical protein
VKRSFQQTAVTQLVAAFAVLVTVGVFSLDEIAYAAGAPENATVSGVVRDVSGVPQIGIEVDLLRVNSTVAARVFTNTRGAYSISSVFPGHYSLKAMGGDFIPTLKENLRLRAKTVVDLTLSNIYDLMQVAPRLQRARANGQDDWAWTLRSAQNRPLLRWQEDGSPILVWDGSVETRPGGNRKQKLKVSASAGNRRFGSGGEEVSVAAVRNGSARRRTAMSAEMAPDASGVVDAMMGFRQEMANSGMGSSSMQSLVAVMADPEVIAGGQDGLQAASLRTWESMELFGGLQAEAGSNQVIARTGDGSEIFAALPFAAITMQHGQSALEYRVATARSADPTASDAMPQAWLPVLSERNGQLVLEHGMHQELGWSTVAGPAEMQVVIYGDHIDNPMIEGSGRLSAEANAGSWLLVDRASGLLRTAGPNYSSAGMLASVESRLPGHNRIKLSYASGDALVMQASSRPADVAAILQGTHSRHAQMYSLVLSGTTEATGTHWRASYRWQPESTVTEVAPYAGDAAEPYLNVYIRQPIRVRHDGPGGVEVLIDVRNLLAEGYQPFLTSDGSHLYFAQAQRSIRGGLAFNF